MRREPKPVVSAASRSAATVDLVSVGDAMLVSVSGLVDERFVGFGDIGAAKTVVLNVSGMTRMTSFGVRQWLRAMNALPKSITDLYLLGCPTFFVDQLNMVLNFGGPARVLSVVAPHTCPACGVESGETIDVLAERANLAKGGLPEKLCARCNGALEFDETPESYFAFVAKYAATSIDPGAAQLLSSLSLYASSDTAAEKPPRIIKLVHGSVTYFRVIGTIGSMFRARPFLVGAEGEVVIDLADVERFDSLGQKEWRRLLKSLAAQVPAVTLVDVNESFLSMAADSLMLARNIAVSAVSVPYGCVECGRTSHESVNLDGAAWPLQFGEHVCTKCGGATRSELPQELLAPLQKASTTPPPASAKVIAQHEELLSRALTDASVAQAGESATAAVAADDTILGKYKIVRRLTAGGMAEVFLAKQVGIGGFEKPVALKRIQRKLLETRHQAIELFLNEAKIAGRLTHPNIVQVLDVGEVGGALYLAMEYVHGKDLRRIIKKLQQTRMIMPLAEACHVVREVAQALDHAYWSTDMAGKRLNVVHRDVSPHNIIVSYDGAVKLLDFGVAMSSVTEHAETMIVGKWLYMSPETTLNDHVDHRSDLFSLGVILYLLCCGYMPFTGSEPREIVKKIRSGQYRPLQEIVAVPEPLAYLVSRLLSPNPDDRPQRGQEVAAELTDIGRQYGLESSAFNLSYILKQLFPNEGGPAPEQKQSSIRDIVRVFPEEMGSFTMKEKSSASHSYTPNSNSVSVSSRALAPIDVSESFRQATGVSHGRVSQPTPPPPHSLHVSYAPPGGTQVGYGVPGPGHTPAPGHSPQAHGHTPPPLPGQQVHGHTPPPGQPLHGHTPPPQGAYGAQSPIHSSQLDLPRRSASSIPQIPPTPVGRQDPSRSGVDGVRYNQVAIPPPPSRMPRAPGGARTAVTIAIVSLVAVLVAAGTYLIGFR